MNMHLVKVLLVAGLAVPLGGCNSLFGKNLFARHTVKPSQPAAVRLASSSPVAAPDAAVKVPSIKAGRDHLTGGRYGLAIEAFRTAMANGETKAPALNGLGVAYASLGRVDLAERYFREAMAEDPADLRFAANYERLMGSPVLALRPGAEQAAAAAQVAQGAARPAPQMRSAPSAALAVQTPAAAQRGRLVRVSSHEFRITSAVPMAAPRQLARAGTAPLPRATVRVQIPQTAVGSQRKVVTGIKSVVRLQLPDSVAAATTARPVGGIAGLARR